MYFNEAYKVVFPIGIYAFDQIRDTKLFIAACYYEAIHLLRLTPFEKC